jgi:hypothetical protein
MPSKDLGQRSLELSSSNFLRDGIALAYDIIPATHVGRFEDDVLVPKARRQIFEAKGPCQKRDAVCIGKSCAHNLVQPSTRRVFVSQTGKPWIVVPQFTEQCVLTMGLWLGEVGFISKALAELPFCGSVLLPGVLPVISQGVTSVPFKKKARQVWA